MKKVRGRKWPKGSAKAGGASHTAPYPLVSSRPGTSSRNPVSTGMKATCTGTISSPITIRKRVSRKGKRIQEKAYAAMAQIASGRSVDGTAIGNALATAANRLRTAPGRSKVIILLTDGENNRGAIDPRTAGKAAAAFGIKIYTVGVGTEGMAPVPVGRGLFGLRYENRPVRIDEPLLTDIANEAPVCPPCHDKLTKHGYRLERRNGVTYTYGPDGTLIHQRDNRWQQ